MSQLSQREIEEAAREAGISPAELRTALAEQAGGGALAHRSERGLLPPSTRGSSVAHAETSLPYAPEQAVRTVKRQVERESGSRGHMVGATEADIYDEANGVIYRIQAESDQAKGALVRVDIDPAPQKGRRTLASMGLGATVGLFLVAGMILPGLLGWGLIGAAVALGAVGGAGLVRGRSSSLGRARSIATQALVEAEHAAPVGGAVPTAEAEAARALPAGPGWEP